jgi:hypothetical protein
VPRGGATRRAPAARPAAKPEPQEAPVVAFGEHNTPRFLLRPAPLAAPAKATVG